MDRIAGQSKGNASSARPNVDARHDQRALFGPKIAGVYLYLQIPNTVERCKGRTQFRILAIGRDRLNQSDQGNSSILFAEKLAQKFRCDQQSVRLLPVKV